MIIIIIIIIIVIIIAIIVEVDAVQHMNLYKQHIKQFVQHMKEFSQSVDAGPLEVGPAGAPRPAQRLLPDNFLYYRIYVLYIIIHICYV